MPTPSPDPSRGPELAATEARQSRPAPGAFLMLAVSTVVGVIAVAVVWAFFAGPLRHTSNTPQISSPQQAAKFGQGTPTTAAPASGG